MWDEIWEGNELIKSVNEWRGADLFPEFENIMIDNRVMDQNIPWNSIRNQETKQIKGLSRNI